MTNSNLSIRVIGVLLVVFTSLYAPFSRSLATLNPLKMLKKSVFSRGFGFFVLRF